MLISPRHSVHYARREIGVGSRSLRDFPASELAEVPSLLSLSLPFYQVLLLPLPILSSLSLPRIPPSPLPPSRLLLAVVNGSRAGRAGTGTHTSIKRSDPSSLCVPPFRPVRPAQSVAGPFCRGVNKLSPEALHPGGHDCAEIDLTTSSLIRPKPPPSAQCHRFRAIEKKNST